MIECTNGRGYSLNGSLDHPGLVTTRRRCPHALIDARILDQVWVGGGERPRGSSIGMTAAKPTGGVHEGRRGESYVVLVGNDGSSYAFEPPRAPADRQNQQV